MPLYEYICEECSAEFEKMMRFDQADQKPVCPDCQSGNTRKKLSIFSSKGAGTVSLGNVSSSSCSSGHGGFT